MPQRTMPPEYRSGRNRSWTCGRTAAIITIMGKHDVDAAYDTPYEQHQPPQQRRATVNRRIVLAGRPRGLPTTEGFRLEEAEVQAPGEGQVLLRTLYLSL